MIRYALKCQRDHGFESWFQSAEAFDALRTAGHVTCPECGSARIEKSLMAPQVRPARSAAPVPKDGITAPANDRDRAIAALRAKVESESEYVGLSFAAEARAIHEGAAPERSIYGEARMDEAKKLIEDGIPVAPLPFTPKAKVN